MTLRGTSLLARCHLGKDSNTKPLGKAEGNMPERRRIKNAGARIIAKLRFCVEGPPLTLRGISLLARCHLGKDSNTSLWENLKRTCLVAKYISLLAQCHFETNARTQLKSKRDNVAVKAIRRGRKRKRGTRHGGKMLRGPNMVAKSFDMMFLLSLLLELDSEEAWYKTWWQNVAQRWLPGTP